MKLYPPPPAPHARRPPRRIPAFHPVPLASRKDGWTPLRQGAFIGWLAKTRSVAAACRKVSMGRESVYRLRKRPGAAGFAAAWDAAMGVAHAPVDLASAKSTGLPPGYRYRVGLIQVVLGTGQAPATICKPDNNALLEFLGRLYRSTRAMPEFEGKPHFSNPAGA
jgi:hypothetical protein